MRVANTCRQIGLFSYENYSLTIASARNSVGDFFEELTACLFGGNRLITDSRKDICPDVFISEGRYCESKSVGKTNASIVYLSRLQKDLSFVREGNHLDYVIWKHKANVYDGITKQELFDRLASTLEYVLIVPFSVYREVSLNGPLMTLNSKQTRRGYGSYGYTTGFRTPLKRFLSLADRKEGTTIYALDRNIFIPEMYAVREQK